MPMEIAFVVAWSCSPHRLGNGWFVTRLNPVLPGHLGMLLVVRRHGAVRHRRLSQRTWSAGDQ